jgi:hypothetical protein
MFPKGISAFRAQTADDTPQCGPLPTRYGKGLIISTGEPTAGSRGSDEAAIFARELTLWVIRASLISQPTGRRSKGANLLRPDTLSADRRASRQSRHILDHTRLCDYPFGAARHFSGH